MKTSTGLLVCVVGTAFATHFFGVMGLAAYLFIVLLFMAFKHSEDAGKL